MKTPVFRLSSLALVAAAALAAAAEPAVSARPVRFSSWTAEGARQESFPLISCDDFASSSRTNAAPGCEVVFLAEAGDGRRIVGFDGDAFEVGSVRARDGRDLLADEAVEDSVECSAVSMSGPALFRVRLDLPEPLFEAPEVHGSFVALVSPSNLARSAALDAAPGARAKVGGITVRVRPDDAAVAALAAFGRLGADDGDEDAESNAPDDSAGRAHLTIEVQAKRAAGGEIVVEADGAEVLRKPLGSQWRLGAEALSSGGRIDESFVETRFESTGAGSFGGAKVRTSGTSSFTALLRYRVPKPKAGGYTVTILRPAPSERVPGIF